MRDDAIQREPPRPAPRPVPRSIEPKPAKPRPRKERPPRERKSASRYRGLAVSPTIITGALMMLGAVVWFGLGLLANTIFIYPPIMFVLGFISLVKGLMGHEDD